MLLFQIIIDRKPNQISATKLEGFHFFKNSKCQPGTIFLKNLARYSKAVYSEIMHVLYTEDKYFHKVVISLRVLVISLRALLVYQL